MTFFHQALWDPHHAKAVLRDSAHPDPPVPTALGTGTSLTVTVGAGTV